MLKKSDGKIILLEWKKYILQKYFLLNTNYFDWIKMYFDITKKIVI